MAMFAVGTGFRDIIGGLAMWRLWSRMGWMDIVRRYRRTTIGPFWAVLGVGVFVATSGFMYAGVFKQDITEYLPYLTAGLAVWVPLNSYVTESCAAFSGSESIVKQSQMPFSVFVFTALVRNFILFFHHLFVFVAVAVIFDVNVNQFTWYAVPALAIFLANALWVGLLVALLCARYRDVNQVVANVMLILFFVTPVMFPAESVRGQAQAVLVDYNPVYHFVELLRLPMLGKPIPAESWNWAFAACAIGWTVTLVLYQRYRHRIVFWL